MIDDQKRRLVEDMPVYERPMSEDYFPGIPQKHPALIEAGYEVIAASTRLVRIREVINTLPKRHLHLASDFEEMYEKTRQDLFLMYDVWDHEEKVFRRAREEARRAYEQPQGDRKPSRI